MPEPVTSTAHTSVLIVDDEPSVARAASRLLHSMGFTVLVATTGNQALEMCRDRNNQIDVVLLDLILQGISSMETLAQMRSLRPGMKVILMSGYGRHESADRFSGMHLEGFVSKPFGYAELENAIRSVLGGIER